MIYILCYRAKKLLEVIFAQMNRKIIATYKIYIRNWVFGDKFNQKKKTSRLQLYSPWPAGNHGICF